MNTKDEEQALDPAPPSLTKRHPHVRVAGAFVGLIVVIVAAVGLSLALYKSKAPPSPVSARVLPCDHPIYCSGPLLRAVQMSGIFPDSKTFVDMPIKSTPEAVLSAFASINASDVVALASFVNEYFDPAGSEVVTATVADFSPDLPFSIVDRQLHDFAHGVHQKWSLLIRRFDTSKYCTRCVSSLPINGPFVVPGGRFREFYYWDSFWIVKGLIASNMIDTAHHTARHMLTFVDQFGKVPNGARVYYLDRSQPPLLTRIVSEVANAMTSVDERQRLLLRAIPSLINELNNWTKFQPVWSSDAGFSPLNAYRIEVSDPRPEGYRADELLARSIPTIPQSELFSDIASGAETGWDFSTRWMATSSLNLTSIRTRCIIPVDLNSILADAESTLSDWLNQTGDTVRSSTFAQRAAARRDAMTQFLWHAPSGAFRDYDACSNQVREEWNAGTAVPLGFSFITNSLSVEQRNSAMEDLRRQIRVGGLPATNVTSGQQWDFPNAWPPLQWFVSRAMENIGNNQTERRAFIQKWIDSNFCGYHSVVANSTHNMFEKYSAVAPGTSGDGGEYKPQEGFGWTNGVALDFLREGASWLVAPARC